MPDREKVVKALEICASREPGGEYICYKCPYETRVEGDGCEVNLTLDAAALLKEQAEIVRCKDCKYWLPMNRFDPDYHPGRGECELNCWVRDFDWFCADGKRKEGRSGND